jgi:aspartate-semialdehyde dehydrogenase
MSSEPRRDRVVVVGATGAVGREALAILAQRGVPASRVRAVASAASRGAVLAYGDGEVACEVLGSSSFGDAQLAVFAASSEIAAEYGPAAVRAGAVVIDNSSHFRMVPKVPLIVPEVNGEVLSPGSAGELVANPNCSTIILSVALEPLRRAFGIESVHVATYQAVSGAGLPAIEELTSQAGEVLSGRQVSPRFFKEPCAFNVFSHDSAVDPVTGRNVEEQKIIDELRRIWAAPDLPITPTCVRVPVMRAHTQAITVRLSRAASEDELREVLEAGEGVAIIDDREHNRFPTPLKVTGRDEVLVGRIRHDPGVARDSAGRSRGVCLLACGDQLRKGAALNAIQIAELCGALPLQRARSTGGGAATIVR